MARCLNLLSTPWEAEGLAAQGSGALGMVAIQQLADHQTSARRSLSPLSLHL